MTHVQYAKVDHLHYLSCNGLLNVFLLVNVSTILLLENESLCILILSR